ncbi:MAG: hypothetical protein NTZ49_01570 [Candidatus Parcubacteria bacterium]|nr:hypothetical protein [Candidatus Parcubacteria bacterium]
MADVILLPLSQLSFAQLLERQKTRRRQLVEFGHSPLIVEIAEKDLEDIEAELKKISLRTKARVKSQLRLVPD